MKLPMLPHDKANHFIYGLIIFALFNIVLGPIVGIIACTVFGVGKEVYDYMNRDKHTPDIYDAIVTIAGGLIGLLIALL